MKIYVYIGASGSGKTTHIVDKFIDETASDIFIENLKMCVCNQTILFGHYNIERRCKGCDTLSMAAINDIIKTIKKLVSENEYDNIVVDGDRINCRKMLEFLLQYKDMVEIVFLDTPLNDIYDRLPDCNKQFVRTTLTKSMNMISEYKLNKFKIEHIKTEPKNKQWW